MLNSLFIAVLLLTATFATYSIFVPHHQPAAFFLVVVVGFLCFLFPAKAR